eukprot:m.44110 g.44110  ORF g.44110 m.44110 type:complete len:306 (-) comp11679_c1_seq1:150-1067(-)
MKFPLSSFWTKAIRAPRVSSMPGPAKPTKPKSGSGQREGGQHLNAQCSVSHPARTKRVVVAQRTWQKAVVYWLLAIVPLLTSDESVLCAFVLCTWFCPRGFLFCFFFTSLQVGEIAAAWHSGRENVTNAWVSSFWYADALGSMSTHNHTGFCRQCLLGGHYGMLRRDTYLPNPDFYLGMLWHDLMGTKVYNVTVSAQGSASQGTNTLRAYAQCSETMTLALINFDKAARYTVSVSGVPSISPRVEYVLSASNNNPEARHISLNGVPIVMEDGGKLPELKGKTVENQPLVLEPFTITFVKLPNVKC